MSPEEKYLCNYNDDPTTKEAFEHLIKVGEENKERAAFVKAEIKAMDDRRNAAWARAEKSPGFKPQEYSVRFNEEGQVFYRERAPHDAVSSFINFLLDK